MMKIYWAIANKKPISHLWQNFNFPGSADANIKLKITSVNNLVKIQL